MTRRLNITEEELNIVHQVIREKGTTQTKLGKLIGCDSAQMSRKLGKADISLTFEEANGIYRALGEDSRLKFLQKDFTESSHMNHWRNLFQSYVSPLEQLYLNQLLDRRVQILDDLEKLKDKYS